MQPTLVRLLCLLATLTLLTTGCGGGDDAAEAPPEATGGADDGASEAASAASELATEASEAGSEAPESEEPSEAASESASASASASEGGQAGGTAPGAGDGTLALGTSLPQTGSLAFLGPPMIAGTELALQDVNAAGGVLGQDVTLQQGDSGDTTTDIASQTADQQIAAGVDAIIGAASSGVSLTIIDAITGAGVVMFSPANTAPDFTDYDDNGLYFRDAPSDVLQGQVLAEVIAEDGHTSVGIMALQDPYGEGLAGFLAENLEASGLTVTDTIIYDPAAQNYDAEVQQIVAGNPDAIAVIGFDESARIITSLIEAGAGPQDKGVYGVDGNMGNALGEQLAGSPGALEGMRGTTPLTDLSEDFQDRLLEVDPNLVDFNYAGESYDAAVIIALATEAAGSDAGPDIAAEIPGVTREGTTCTSFEECLPLVQAGEDIDYDGVTGPIELNDVGDPTVASYGILEFGPDNALIDPPEFRQAQLDEG